MNVQDEAQRAALLLDVASRPGPVTFRAGRATSYTDGDGDTDILLDSVASPPSEDTAVADEADPNAPVTAQTVCGPVALDERVWCMSAGSGLYILGSMGSQPRLIGLAAIAGGATDVPVVGTSATELGSLRAEATVTHPNHLIQVQVNVHLQSAGAANLLIGRVRRADPDGTNTELGRFLRSSAMALNETIQAGPAVIDIAPDGGSSYDYYPTVEASVGGFTVILDPSSTPAIAAYLSVYDMGPLPQGTTLT